MELQYLKLDLALIIISLKIFQAMTEPETCSSEFHSDLERLDSENGSNRKSVSDNNTDTSACNIMVNNIWLFIEKKHELIFFSYFI